MPAPSTDMTTVSPPRSQVTGTLTRTNPALTGPPTGPPTAAHRCALLPDVPNAMVYRHVDLLASGGTLEVADEQRVRGAVERHYRLHQERASIDPETAASLSPGDHRRGFAAATAALVA